MLAELPPVSLALSIWIKVSVPSPTNDVLVNVMFTLPDSTSVSYPARP